MPRILDDIKSRNFKNLYLVYGEEAYLRNYYKNALKNALVTEGDNLNYSYFEGSDCNISEIVDLVNTMPFMAEHRVVILENSSLFSKSSDGGEEENPSPKKGKASGDILTNALTEISEDVIVIFSEEKPDKRNKLFKLIEKNGCAEEFPKATDDYLRRWIAGYLRNEGKEASGDTINYILSEIGNDMYTLSNELNKLTSWALDKDTITKADVDNVCTHQVNNKIFDMISAIAAHKREEALALYYDLLILRESPYHILTLLVRQYRQLLEVRSLMDNGEASALIASKTAIQEWLVKRFMQSLKGVGKRTLMGYLEACAKADEDIKNGNLTDNMSIELLIISCCDINDISEKQRL